jgi:hypothetical protein
VSPISWEHFEPPQTPSEKESWEVLSPPGSKWGESTAIPAIAQFGLWPARSLSWVSSLTCVSLQSIAIPRIVRFLDISAMRNGRLASISIRIAKDQLVIWDDLLSDRIEHKSIRSVSNSREVRILLVPD